jgi:hypothetical protein
VSERAPEPYVPPSEPAPEDPASNARFGLALFAVFLVLFAGTVGIALVYLALD